MPSAPPSHKPGSERLRRAVARQKERQRGSAAARGYDTLWRKLREAYLARHPLCRACKRAGRLTPATDVDHIIPHRGDDALRLDWNNLQALCRPCHSAKTATEDGGFGRPLPGRAEGGGG